MHILPKAILKRQLFETDLTTTAVIICSDDNALYKQLLPDNTIVVPFADTTIRNQANAITSEQANEIIGFIKNLPICIQDLYICCDAGESRSPAVAAAILRMSGKDDNVIWENPFYHPNWLIFQVICREFGLLMPDWHIKQLVELNKRCYINSVRNGNTGNYEKWQIIE